MSLLMLCGDIESNPGPTTEQLLAQLLEGQNNIQQRLNDIELKIKNIEASTLALKDVGKKVSDLEKTVQSLRDSVVDLEDRSRRNNLLVFGIPEKDKEMVDDLRESIIQDVFTKILGVHISSVERLHRIGRKQPSSDRPRPVILKLIDHREKINILVNCSKLKGSDISISEDFSLTTRIKRKKLWDSTSELRKSDRKVKLVHDKVKIDDELFQWDDCSSKLVPISSRGRKQTPTKPQPRKQTPTK